MEKIFERGDLPGVWDFESLSKDLSRAPLHSLKSSQQARKLITSARAIFEASAEEKSDKNAYAGHVLDALARLRDAVNYDIRLLAMHANREFGMSAAAISRYAKISDGTLSNWKEKGWEDYGDPDYDSAEYAALIPMEYRNANPQIREK